MNLKNADQPIVHQEFALDTYLSMLLEEIPVDDVFCEQRKERIKQLQKKEIAEAKQKSVDDLQIKTKNHNETIVKPLFVMPEWTQKEFQAIFFKIDKLIFATPAIQLLKVIKYDKKPTIVSGQPSWFIGLLDTNEQRVGVIDTKQLILGENKGQQKKDERQQFDNLLITLDGKWGLACNEVLSIETLKPEKVRWRVVRKNRPWLIGMLIEELTAVLDVNHLLPYGKCKV
ncbi:MAG: chemotaxis protein CheW [Methylococcales bacterium]|nr:chemotaxis protein CheW [Methylococcales bacterium]